MTHHGANHGVLRVGVLATIDPDDLLARLDAAVVRHQLELRLGPLVVALRTTLPSARPERHTDWRPMFPSSWPSDVDAVIVDRRVPDDLRSRAGVAGTVVDTDLWTLDTPLAALVESAIGPVSMETRQRMLEHLDVHADDLHHHPLVPSVVDLLLFARRGELDDGDTRVEALRSGRTVDCSELDDEFDRVADALRPALPTEAAGPSSSELVVQLAAERLARRHDQQAAATALDEAVAETERLRGQLASASLRRALVDGTS